MVMINLYDSLINELSGFYGRADIAYVPILITAKQIIHLIGILKLRCL